MKWLDGVRVVTVNEFPFELVKRSYPALRKQGNPGTKNLQRYIHDFACFDIETTGVPEVEQSFMYIWQFYFKGYVCVGRTWAEFLRLCDGIMINIRKGCKIVVYVHNLSYEFQFLRGVYGFAPDEVFATESRKVLKCSMFEALEFRCSYMLTNMGLDRFTSKMGVKHGKLSGEAFDYSKRRYPWTELSDEELHYCINDVVGLHEAIELQMERDEDNLYSIPLTSTGYVRRDVKRAMRSFPRKRIKALQPDYDLYKLLRQAFRGGNTHANRYYVNKVLHGVTSYDIASSYPTVICECKYPMKPFDCLGAVEPGRLEELLEDGRAFVAQVAIYGLQLRDQLEGFPYLPLAKSRQAKGWACDNGRFLECDYLETTFTDIDYRIIKQQYDWDSIEVVCVYESTYGKLPDPIIDSVLGYFDKKTALKGVAGQEYYYAKSKELLNAIYGMMAQDPVKQSILFENDEFREDDRPLEELLAESNGKAFLTYAWGVWVTAHARARLQAALDYVGCYAVYCDTDSVKFVGDFDFKELNSKLRRLAGYHHAFADRDGQRYYMGVYERDAEYPSFVTMGAKKYAYTDKQNCVHVTTAGVNKSKGAVELARAADFEQRVQTGMQDAIGPLQLFEPLSVYREGFIFREAGGTESVYNDQGLPSPLQVEGHELNVSANVYIADSTYTLGQTAEYKRVLAAAGSLLEYVEQLEEDCKIPDWLLHS